MDATEELCKLAEEYIGQRVLNIKFQDIAFENTFEGERNGRYFHDLTEEKAEKLFTELGLNIEKMWITKDVRQEYVDEIWLNNIVGI